jgi:hypothetical protein
VQPFPPPAAFNVDLNAVRVGRQPEKARIEGNFRSTLSRLTPQRGNQFRSLDDKVRLGQRNLRGATICEEFEPPNLVHNALVRRCSQLPAELIGHNQRPRQWLQASLGLQHTHALAAVSALGGGVKSGRRASHNYYFFVILAQTFPLVRLQPFPPCPPTHTLNSSLPAPLSAKQVSN